MAVKAPTFVVTVESKNTATGEKIDIAHWTTQARSLNEAEQIFDGQIRNVNRTISSIVNTKIKVEPFNPNICQYLARNINCQGHRERKPLAQQRGGNEQRV